MKTVPSSLQMCQKKGLLKGHNLGQSGLGFGYCLCVRRSSCKGGSGVIPVSQVRKPKLRIRKELSQGHSAGKYDSLQSPSPRRLPLNHDTLVSFMRAGHLDGKKSKDKNTATL